MTSESAGKIVLVWTTYPADGDAGALARLLVEERVAACVSVHRGLRSVYPSRAALESSLLRPHVAATPEQTRTRLSPICPGTGRKIAVG